MTVTTAAEPPSSDGDQPPGGDPVAYSPEAVLTLHKNSHDDVTRYVNRRLCSYGPVGTTESEDIVNGCWVELIRRWRDSGCMDTPRAWLFRLAQLRCTDWQRRRGIRAHDVADPDNLMATAQELLNSREFEHDLITRLDMNAALRALPIRQRQALVLHHMFDLRNHDVGALLGCSETDVKNLLKQGKTTLRKSTTLVGYHASRATGGAHK